MGLVYWSPCLGELKNQGLSTAQTTSTSFSADANGKIGKCIKVTSGIDTGLPGTSWDINQNSITMMGWFKFPESEIRAVVNSYTAWDSTHANMLCLLLGNNSYGGLSLHLLTNNIYSSGTVGTFTNLNVTASIRSGSSVVRTTGASIPFDKWVHIAGVFDINTKVEKIYINGTLQKTNSIANPLANDVPMRNFYICNNQVDSGNGPAEYFPFYCNDIRVYTEALKDEKISKIARGLVLHYTLANPYIEPTSNLAPADYGITSTCFNGATTKYGYGENTDMYRERGVFEGRYCTKVHMGIDGNSAWPYVYFNNQTNVGETKTLSFDYFPSAIDKVNFYNLSTTTDLVYEVNGTRGTGTNSITLPVNVGQWNHIVLTATNTGTANGGMGYMRIGTGSHTSSTENYWLFSNVQVELKDHPTGYTPYGKTRTESIVKDISGNQYNGVGNAITLSYYEDAPVYKMSTVFNGTNSRIRTTANSSYIGTGDFTISAWVYLTSSGKTYQPIISNKATTAASVGCAIYFNHNQNKFLWSTADGSGATEIWTANTFADIYDKWTHVVMVRNSADQKVGYFYINGVRQELTSVPAIRNISTEHEFVIGELYTDSSNYRWTGKISDIRFYATALDEDSIEGLYETGVTG